MKKTFIHNIKKNSFAIFKKLIKFKIFRIFCRILFLIPVINDKHKNIILNLIEQAEKKIILKSFPYIGYLNVSNLCNYRCKFCEIHYFYWKAKKESDKIWPNELTLDFIKNFQELFSKIKTIELTGATGEPFLNKNFLAISDYLTNQLDIFCTATTNGSLITEETAEKLAKMPFGFLLFSIHGANKKIYQEYQGGDLNKIFNTIKTIQNYKQKYNSPFPKITVNFLICKKNTEDLINFLDKLKELKIDFLNINNYYDSRNKLSKEISFYFNPENGNKVIQKIYAHADKIGLKLQPANPPLFNTQSNDSPLTREGKTEKNINNHFCSAPFDSIKFKGCVEHPDSNYIGICNRIILFRLNYKEFFDTQGKFFDIWNHELLQYFRETVRQNPICQFCKNPETPKIRCINNIEYSRKRDEAIHEFFSAFNQKYPNYKKITGLYMLDKNPYEYNENDQF